MHSPYTNDLLGAFTAAEAAVAGVLTAALAIRPLRNRVGSPLLIVAMWIVAIAPAYAMHSGVGPPGFGARLPLLAWLEPFFFQHALAAARVLATAGAFLSKRRAAMVWAVASEVSLMRLTDFLVNSDLELSALHMACFGVLVGLSIRRRRAPGGTTLVVERSYALDDVVLFVMAVAAGASISHFLLGRFTNSGDEWAYTFQASVFAKGRAYAHVPPCGEAFRAYWVFHWNDRAFSQYTPGWPIFMAPFVGLSAAWLAGPFSLGLLVVGVARAARRVMSKSLQFHAARLAGILAGVAVLLGPTFIINGGSRFPHVFVGALFAWCIERVLALAGSELGPAAQWRAGLVLGTAASFMIATRPADGLLLGVGLFLGFAWIALRRRVPWRTWAGTLISFGLWGALFLAILRLQIGEWFKTGYSITPFIYPWTRMGSFSVPGPSEFKWGLPLATGSYCWWPCSIAAGLAGLLALGPRARLVNGMFVVSFVSFITFYTALEMGRGSELGYGPRYLLPLVVPMAVGTGTLLAMMWSKARRLRVPGQLLPFLPPTIAMASVVGGAAWIAPLVYPITHEDVWAHNHFRLALDQFKAQNALVWVGDATRLTTNDPMDLTENWPLELYPKQRVLVALDRIPGLVECAREAFPTRTFYRVIPGETVTFVPF